MVILYVRDKYSREELIGRPATDCISRPLSDWLDFIKPATRMSYTRDALVAR